MGCGGFLAKLLGSRLVLLALLYAATGGREISNDTAMHMEMARAPFHILLGSNEVDNYPEFLPSMEAWLAYPLQRVMPDFFALRLTFIFYEGMLGFLFYRAMELLGLEDGRKRLCLAGFLILPMGWMTSTVMPQDEVIGSCLTLLPIVATLAGWPLAGLALAAFGVLAGKVFIVLVLIVLFAACRAGTLWVRLLAALGPLAAVYVPVCVARVMHGQLLPLEGFHPDPYSGTGFWILWKQHYGLDLAAVGPYSGMVALAAALVPVWWARRAPVILTVNCTLMLFLALFYHVQAEYFIFVVPLMLLTATGLWDWVACATVATLPWVVRFFQNAVSLHQADETTGKYVARKYFQTIFPGPAQAWLEGSEALFATVMLGIAVVWCLRLKRTGQPRLLR